MCGRFALYSPVEMIRDHYNLSAEVSCSPRYNISPGQLISSIIRGNSGVFEHSIMLWGLIPYWAKDRKIGSTLTNARSETVAEKPSFKKSFAESRCLIPADGFFEWQKREGQKTKQPFFIHRRDKQLFSFAGLWSRWVDRANGDIVDSCAILTIRPNKLVAEIHDRMPVIVSKDMYEEWLDPGSDTNRLFRFFSPFDPAVLVSYPVGMLVNNVSNDVPDCINKISIE